MIGIYKYTNKINNKIYIGMSNDMRLRHKNGESSRDIYEGYKDKITYKSFQNILSYQNWKHITV